MFEETKDCDFEEIESCQNCDSWADYEQGDGFWVSCQTGCMMKGPIKQSLEEAIENWNKVQELLEKGKRYEGLEK